MLGQPTLNLTNWLDRLATRPGHLGKNLTRDIRTSNRNHLEWLLRCGLPRCNISPVLIRASHEILELRWSATVVGRLGLERALVHQIRDESDNAASALGSMADRIAAFAAQGVMNRELELLLLGETTKLMRLIEAAHALRESLAHLTLTNRDSQSVEGTEAALRCLADSASPLFV
jgi:hypothetical protein